MLLRAELARKGRRTIQRRSFYRLVRCWPVLPSRKWSGVEPSNYHPLGDTENVDDSDLMHRQLTDWNEMRTIGQLARRVQQLPRTLW